MIRARFVVVLVAHAIGEPPRMMLRPVTLKECGLTIDSLDDAELAAWEALHRQFTPMGSDFEIQFDPRGGMPVPGRMLEVSIEVVEGPALEAKA